MLSQPRSSLIQVGNVLYLTEDFQRSDLALFPIVSSCLLGKLCPV
jgi:hypothetical protein